LQLRVIVVSRVNSLHRQLNKQKAQLEKLNKELFESPWNPRPSSPNACAAA
jgi:hypothetical protein